jgi:hypothetical protein
MKQDRARLLGHGASSCHVTLASANINKETRLVSKGQRLVYPY